MGKKTTQTGRILSVALLAFSTSIAWAAGPFNADAIRLNNRGVAHMGQQFTEKAAASFTDAFKHDPKMAQAAVNEGIALMTLAEAR